ncbi:MAG: tetratricopeptide repeat protein, partial [Cyanobacteriota bacterium]|nr:tetratricopeptide repeat protein [Cyanobacteriota bacterium]
MAGNASRSLQVSPEKFPLIEKALLQFPSKRDLAAQLGMSPNTVTNFFKGRNVQRQKFHRICKKLKVDWREVAGIAEVEEKDNSQPEATPETPLETEPIRQIPHNIPREGKAGFFGREEELGELRRRLREEKQVAIAAVAGMGGMGKTELAVRYARKYLSVYPGGVCWIDCRGIPGLQIVDWVREKYQLAPHEESQLSAREDLAARVRWCWDYLASLPTLVVFDDVSHYSQQVAQYLPTDSLQTGGIEVLLTTRLDLGIEQLSLNELQPLAALELLREVSVKQEKGQLAGIERLACDVATRQDDASALCEWLGYLPLGLELAGRYLARQSDLSFGKMLARLQKKGLAHKALMGDETTDPTWTLAAKRGVAAAFELSWEGLDEKARVLGCQLSLYAPVRLGFLSREVLEEWLEDEDAAEDWVEARGELEKHHLLQAEDGGYRFHPLIREFFALKRGEYPEAEEWQQQFIAQMVAVARKIPETPTRAEIQSLEPQIPHLVEVAERWVGEVDDEDVITLFTRLGRFYQGQGFYSLAEPWYKTCRDMVCKRLGNNHPDVATSLNNLASLYFSQGRYEDAEPLYLDALALRRKLLGENHPDVATSLNNLASLYFSQGRYEEAEPLHQDALALRRKLLGENHPDVATSLNNLASLYFSQGRYEEAEPLYQDALTLIRKLLGNEHPHVATSLNNLAYLYSSQGRYEDAEPLYLDALALRRKLLGDNHPDVASSLNNLAGLYSSQGRYEDAEPLLQDALALRRELLGDNHPDVASSLNNLAELYRSQGRYEDAEPLLQDALALWRKLLGEDHPHVASSLNNLAELYRCQGRYEDAEPLYLDALTLVRKLLGNEHPHVATSLNNLAGLYKSQGRYEDAEPLYLDAL